MKTVYITGATAGLGRAIATLFSAQGYRLGLIARDDQALDELARLLPSPSAFAAADVADFTQLEIAARKIEAQIGPPDVWINNAMATIFSRFDDITPQEFTRAVGVTLHGSINGIQIALKSMKPRNKGHIIQIGSALAYRAIPLQAPYCAAKHALRAAIDSLRCELIYDKSPLRITMAQMPGMNTPQFDWARRHIDHTQQPVPPVYAPEACAKAVLWAASHPNRREIWVGLSTFEAILGNKFFPALMDYYMARKAYKGQFDKRGAPNTDGNLFDPVAGFHTTEGRFGKGQRMQASWAGTSWRHEAAFIVACILLGIGVVAALLL